MSLIAGDVILESAVNGQRGSSATAGEGGKSVRTLRTVGSRPSRRRCLCSLAPSCSARAPPLLFAAFYLSFRATISMISREKPSAIANITPDSMNKRGLGT